MRILQDALSLAFIASGLLGIQILVYDKWLWSAAASHAYGLVGFVVLDLLLTLAIWFRRGLALLGATLVSASQLAAMTADLFIGQPIGVPSIAFRNYLLNDLPYIGLLIAQLVIMILATGALTVPRVAKHVHWHLRIISGR